MFSKIGGAQRRWCVIREGIFYYFDKDTDKENRAAFSLAGMLITLLHPRTSMLIKIRANMAKNKGNHVNMVKDKGNHFNMVKAKGNNFKIGEG